MSNIDTNRDLHAAANMVLESLRGMDIRDGGDLTTATYDTLPTYGCYVQDIHDPLTWTIIHRASGKKATIGWDETLPEPHIWWD